MVTRRPLPFPKSGLSPIIYAVCRASWNLWEPGRGEGVSESTVERIKPVQPGRNLEQGDHTGGAAPPPPPRELQQLSPTEDGKPVLDL